MVLRSITVTVCNVTCLMGPLLLAGVSTAAAGGQLDLLRPPISVPKALLTAARAGGFGVVCGRDICRLNTPGVRVTDPRVYCTDVVKSQGLATTRVGGTKQTIILVSKTPCEAIGLKHKVSRARFHGFTLNNSAIELADVVQLCARAARVNVVMSKEVHGPTAMDVEGLHPLDVLRLVAHVNGLRMIEVPDVPNTYLVTHLATGLPAFEIPADTAKPQTTTVKFRYTDVRLILEQLSRLAEVKLDMSSSVRGKMAFELKGVRPREALRAICAAADLTVRQKWFGQYVVEPRTSSGP